MDYLTGEDRHQTRVLSAGRGAAVPLATRHDAVQEAKAKGATKEARAEVRRAYVPPELKELAVQRVVADTVNPPPQTIKLSRQQIVDKFPKPAFYVDIQGLSNDDRNLARRIDDLAQWLKGIGYACFADTANRTANLTRRLTPPFYDLLENRARFNQKPSRSCRAAEAELLPKARRVLDQLAKFATAQIDANADTPWAAAWQAVTNRIAETGQLLAEHPMPEQLSPYETDEYEALAAMSADDLNRIAIRSITDYKATIRSKERKLLLPGQWIATWCEGPNGKSEPDVRYWTPTFGYDAWEDYIAACSHGDYDPSPYATLKDRLTPDELAAEAEENVAALKPADCQAFVNRFLNAAFIELEQRVHTMPPEMHDTVLDTFQNLGNEISRQEHYTAGRYRQIIAHSVEAYLACRYPGRWQAAVDALDNALATPRRNLYRHFVTPTTERLREWRSLADNHHEAELAEQRQQGEHGSADPAMVWRAVISAAPKVETKHTVAIAAATTKRRRPAPAPELTPHLL